MRIRRRSRKREAILELYKSTKVHPGAKWVYEELKPQFPDLSLGTVYRNIKILHEEGELGSVGVINSEERFDGVTMLHSHAICTCCGQIKDLDELKISGNFSASISDFSIDTRKIVFYGLCKGCMDTAAMGR